MIRTSLLFAIFSLVFLSGINAQEDDESPRNEAMDNFIIDISWETFIDKPERVSYRWYNNGFNFSLFFDQPVGERTGMSVALGAGLSTQSYYSDHQIRRDTTGTRVDTSSWQSAEPDYRNNKVSTTWVGVPFEIRYRSAENANGNRVKVTGGARFDFLLDVHDKLITSERLKLKTYDIPDVLNYRIGVYTRISYGKVGLYGFYNLTGLFQPGRGRGMNQLSVGISIAAF